MFRAKTSHARQIVIGREGKSTGSGLNARPLSLSGARPRRRFRGVSKGSGWAGRRVTPRGRDRAEVFSLQPP